MQATSSALTSAATAVVPDAHTTVKRKGIDPTAHLHSQATDASMVITGAAGSTLTDTMASYVFSNNDKPATNTTQIVNTAQTTTGTIVFATGNTATTASTASSGTMVFDAIASVATAVAGEAPTVEITEQKVAPSYVPSKFDDAHATVQRVARHAIDAVVRGHSSLLALGPTKLPDLVRVVSELPAAARSATSKSKRFMIQVVLEESFKRYNESQSDRNKQVEVTNEDIENAVNHAVPLTEEGSGCTCTIL